MKEDQEIKSLEAGMERLRQIAERLEEKDLPIEEAVALFEEGMKLVQKCSCLLNEAEERVRILMKEETSGKILEKELGQKESTLDSYP